MSSFRKRLNTFLEDNRRKRAKGAQRTMLEELFNDFYLERHKVYKMNFFRGIFFGLGSVIGGTIVIGMIISITSLFVDFPVIGDFFQNTQDSLEQSVKSE